MQGRSRIEHQNLPPSSKGMPNVPIDTLLVSGPASWGAFGPIICTSWPDFEKKFGGLMAGYYTAIEIQQFFAMRSKAGFGARVIMNRIAHWDGSGAPATAAKAYKMAQTGATSPTYATVTGTVAGPFALSNGDTAIATVDSVLKPTSTFVALPAVSQNQIDGPFNITPESTQDFSINGGSTQRVTFHDDGSFLSIAAATATELAAVYAAQLIGVNVSVTGGGKRVTLTTDKKGTGASINLVESGGGPYGADANEVIQFNVATISGSGYCVDADSVTLAEVKTWLEGIYGIADIIVGSSGSYLTVRTNTPGASGNIQIMLASTSDTKMGLDNTVHVGTAGGAVNTLKVEALCYGVRGNALSYAIEAADDSNAEHFNLVIYETGYARYRERYPNVTMDTAAERYVVSVVNTLAERSDLLRVTDEAAPGSATQRRPATTVAAYLTGGNDGLTGLVTDDYVGTTALRVGLFAFSSIQEGALMICPDNTTTTYQNAAIDYCATVKQGKVIFIPDPPASSTSSAMINHEAALTKSESRSGSYWPRIKIANPDKGLYGVADSIVVPGSGMRCGRMALNTVQDLQQQMFRQPSNEKYGELDNAVGLETDEVNDESVLDAITDAGINPICSGIRKTDNTFGVWMHDCQAGLLTGNWKTIGENRWVAHMRQKIEAYLEVHRTQGNSELERTIVQRDVTKELSSWMGTGVYETNDPALAFYVNADVKGESLNNATVREAQAMQVLWAADTSPAARLIRLLTTRDVKGVQTFVQKQLASGGQT